MPFKYDVSDELEETLEKLCKKDRQTYESLMKKIVEIASRDVGTIEFYKNLRYDLKEYKRVHVAKSFVLMFKVFKEQNFMVFDKFRHHDEIYKR